MGGACCQIGLGDNSRRCNDNPPGGVVVVCLNLQSVAFKTTLKHTETQKTLARKQSPSPGLKVQMAALFLDDGDGAGNLEDLSVKGRLEDAFITDYSSRVRHVGGNLAGL